MQNRVLEATRRSLHLELAGGRSSNSGLTATVFGCTGFLGRYVVNSLGRIGTRVVVPYRGEEMGFAHLKPMGDLGQILPTWFSVRDRDSVRDALRRSDVVINLIGKPWDTRNFRMEEIHVDVPRTIAELATECGVERLVHVSAIGVAEGAPSEFADTKARGERAVREAFPRATILRPAPVFGFQDRFLRRYAHMARFWPAMPVISGAARVQPLFANDFARAVVGALASEDAAGKAFDLAGPRVYTIEELLRYVREVVAVPRKPLVPVPVSLARAAALVAERFQRSPRFVSDELEYYNSSPLIADGALPTIAELGVGSLGGVEDVAAASMLRLYRRPSFLNMELS